MGEKGSIKRNISDYRFFICILTFSVLIILFTLIILGSYHAVPYDDFVPYEDMWSYENGSLVDINNLKTDEYFEIHKRTNGEVINNKSLCFYTKNIHFSVYLDGEEIYSFHPKGASFVGKAYGIYPHSITIPVLYRDGNLKIAIQNLYPGKAIYISEMKLNNSTQFIMQEMKESTYEALFCIIMFVFGVILFIIGLSGKYFDENRYEIVSMGCFSMTASLWIICENQMFAILTGAPVIVHCVEYITLDLLAFPGIVFIAMITGNKNTRLTALVGTLSFLKIVYSVWSTTSGHKDYHELLFLSHINLCVAILATTYLIIKGFVQKKIKKLISVLFLISFILSMMLGILDIVLYLNKSNSYDSLSFYKYTLFLFIIISGIYEFLMINEMTKKGKYAEIMEELAYNDGLTGLMNRQAFNKFIGDAAKSDSTYKFIMLDLNYLKKVNDEFGHSVGDDYINAAADCIKNSFNHGENCFRIGGDEFFVLLKASQTELIDESIESLNKKVEDFNSGRKYSIPLSIAYGLSDYDPSKDDSDVAIKSADENMYKMKTIMKSVRE